MARGRGLTVKPDPRIFDDVVAELSNGTGHGGRGVMIGDSVTDLQTARAANVPCILMSYGYTPVPAASLGADTGAGSFRGVAGCNRAIAFLMACSFAA